MRRTALVTGGAGFIGSHLADALLERGFAVVVLDNESTGLPHNVPRGAQYIRGDVTNPADVRTAFGCEIDIVLHVAGQASTIYSFSEPLTDLMTNVAGAVNVLEQCIAHKVPRILYASSMTVYGHPQTLPITELHAPGPISYYGITKYAAERYIMATAMRSDLGFKLNATAFRMFNVYGRRQRLDNPYQGVLGIFLGNMLRHETITIHGDGEQSRDFVHVEDVVRAWVAALDNPAAYDQVFNLGCGQGISMNRLVEDILNVGGFDRDGYPISYGPVRPGDQRHMVADIQRARDVLHWEPRISLAAGLESTLDWAKSASAP
jgi:UDP-glucose 4-epimerase